MRNLPPPGLNGNYEGACVVCLRPTDSGLAFEGDAEWTIVGLMKLGFPKNQAEPTARIAWGTDPGMVPAGKVTTLVSVCAGDAARTGMQVGLLSSGRIPAYQQPRWLRR